MEHQALRASRMERYAAGVASVEAMLAEGTPALLDRRPADGGWTARENVHHLADMEAIAYIRLRRLIAEERPVLDAPDEPAYARALHYDRPISASMAVLRAVRAASLELLERLTEEEWKREGVHPRVAEYDVERWLQIYAEHPHNHAAQMRTAMGLA